MCKKYLNEMCLANTIKEMSNQFTEDISDLLALDSRDIAAYPAVIDTVPQIEILGEEQHDAYVKEWLVSQTKPISDPIIADLQSERRQSHSY